jgi:beta-N-acetylhexosaminidase
MPGRGEVTGRELNGCLLARFAGPQVPDWLRQWLDDGLAGVVLFAGNITGPDQLRTLTAGLRAHNPAVLIAADEEGGAVTRLEAGAGSSFPGNAALGAAGDPDLTRQIAGAIGASLAAAGLNLDLAPVADLDASPQNPVIGVRSFGAGPELAAAHTAAFVAGLHDWQVAACVKHFPGHGRAAGDSHRELPSVPASLRQLRAADLRPFAAAIEAGVRCVMTAHVVFPEVDPAPATLSARWLGGVLRAELGFGGVILSDALDMAAIGAGRRQAAAAVRAMAAGADLLCLPASRPAQLRARQALMTAIEDGSLPGHRVTAAAGRIAELAGWVRQQPGGQDCRLAVRDGQALGLAAARRALRVELTAPAAGAPFVLDAGWLPGSEAGEPAASLLGQLAARLPGTSGTRLADPGGRPAGGGHLAVLLATARGRPLVVAVRDAHRRPWQQELLAEVLAARPDAIVVGTGTTHDRILAGPNYLGTRGAALPNLSAAADVLAGLLAGAAEAGTGR